MVPLLLAVAPAGPLTKTKIGFDAFPPMVPELLNDTAPPFTVDELVELSIVVDELTPLKVSLPLMPLGETFASLVAPDRVKVSTEENENVPPPPEMTSSEPPPNGEPMVPALLNEILPFVAILI